MFPDGAAAEHAAADTAVAASRLSQSRLTADPGPLCRPGVSLHLEHR